jgi:L-amino acid N-acyltransferase YncA
MQVREAEPDDWPSIFPIFSAITAAGETYTYPDDLSFEQARDLWMGQGRVVVAVDEDSVVGTATMGPNRPGRAAHIATGSFMVAPDMQGHGVGRRLGQHLVQWARAEGFRGIQFNAVVETNTGAVGLRESLGFTIIGTVPGAFDHPKHGYVGLHVMFLPLAAR